MEAFVYKWTVPSTGMMYIGYHKGNPDDGYLTSSEDAELLQAIRSGVAQREVIAQGSDQDMLALEHKLLVDNDAANNPLYFNRHNGQVKQVESGIDFNLLEGVYKKILKGHANEAGGFLPKLYGTGDVEEGELPAHQVRAKTIDDEKVSVIMDLLAVSDKDVSPLIIIKDDEGTGALLTDEGKPTKRLLIDGNHTRAAILKSRARQISVYEVKFSSLNNKMLNVHQLGTMLNRPEGKIKTPNSDEDLVRQLTEYSRTLDISDIDFQREYARSVKKQLKSIQKLVNKVKPDANTGSFITGDTLKYYQEKFKKAFQGEVYFSSCRAAPQALGYVGWLLDKEGIDSLTVCYTYGKPEEADRGYPEDWGRFIRLCKQAGYKVDLYELRHSTTQTDDYTFISSSYKD